MIRQIFVLAIYAYVWVQATPAIADLQRAMDATCRVRSSNGSSGTGCAFDRDSDEVFVLTNHHVAGGIGSRVTCEFWRDGYASPRMPGRVVWSSFAPNGYRDISIISIQASAFPPSVSPATVRLGNVGAAIPDSVASVGCANGGWPTAWVGRVVGGHARTIEFVPPPAGGRSGSALFSPDGERIVGLIAWRTSNGTGRAMGLAEIHAALRGEATASVRHGGDNQVQHKPRMRKLTQEEKASCNGGNCLPRQPYQGREWGFGIGGYRYRSVPPQGPAPSSGNPWLGGSGGGGGGLAPPQSPSPPPASSDNCCEEVKKIVAKLKAEWQSTKGDLAAMDSRLEQMQVSISEIQAEIVSRNGDDDPNSGWDDGSDSEEEPTYPQAGPRGPRGPPGDPGPVGPRGPPGASPKIDYQRIITAIYQQMKNDPEFRGRDAQIDIEAMKAAVIESLPPVRVEIIDKDGKVKQKQSKRLGQPLRFQLVPVK